eukprot:160344-Rhodomonas_salina.1
MQQHCTRPRGNGPDLTFSSSVLPLIERGRQLMESPVTAEGVELPSPSTSFLQLHPTSGSWGLVPPP